VQYIVLQYVHPINIFIAILATSNILHCNIFGHQYICCNTCHHQYIVLQYLRPSIYLLQYLPPPIYCIAISLANNIFYCNICDHQYIVLQYYIQSTMFFCSVYRQVTKNTLNCNIRCINIFADKSDIRSCNLQNTKSSNNNT
jgi:hypothetical protein